MTVDAAPRERTYAVPASAWVLGWASVAMQLVTLADRGITSEASALGSVPLGALVVGWVSAGVVRARMVRTCLAGVILLLVTAAGVVDLVAGPSLLELAGTAAAAVALGAFVSYVRSDCFTHLRSDRRAVPLAVGSLVVLAAVVGALGGLTAPVDDPDRGSGVHLRIGL